MKKITLLITAAIMAGTAPQLLAADAPWLADFRKADLNDSGGLSQVELDKSKSTLLKSITDNFKAIDADGDGQVTYTEYRKHQSAQGKAVVAPPKDGCTKKCGVVIDVDRYKTEGEGGATGMIAGGVAGGVVGNQAIGGTLGTLGGAAAGAFAGNEIQKRMNTKKMVKVTVRFDDGTQHDYNFEGEKSEFKRGERVQMREGHLKHFKGN